MKYLMLMRHGEAHPPEIGHNDKIRQLTRKGRSDIQRMHIRLLADGLMPEFAVASDSTRTQATALEVIGHDFKGGIEFNPALYNAEKEIIIDEARLLKDQYKKALIIAHNPGIFLTILDLVNAASLPELSQKTDKGYKPGTLTILECPIDRWSDLKLQNNKLSRLLIPD